ncbi:tetratricopeptide repeat protein [Odoribacter lunatus]|uniref:tetratricopeptide repeat protein n=1 Tax=Odoribacter lunatus TaxID=2941335 RepID=UPI00203F781C|nr:hypothetical protein [Odoribacter lunatus]
MNNKWLWTAIAILGMINICFSLPIKQKEIVEKLIVENSFEKALSVIESFQPTDTTDVDMLLLKGICYYNISSQKEQAISTLQNALSLSKNRYTDIDIIYHLAQAYEANTKYTDALNNYKQLQKLVPEKFQNFHQKIDTQIILCKQHLILTPETTETSFISSDSLMPENYKPAAKQYTIQICSMSFPLSDTFFKGQYGVKLIRMGDIYRYIYNIYPSIEEARTALPTIRKIYPDAFIREIDEEKLGQAVDLNMDRIK